MKKVVVLISFIFSFLWVPFAVANIKHLDFHDVYDGLENRGVTRNVDISKDIEKVDITLTCANVGEDTAPDYFITISAEKAEHLSYIQAWGGTVFTVEHVTVDSGKHDSNIAFYRVKFPQPISPGKTLKFDIQMMFTHVLTPLPAKIRQSDKQLMKYEDDHYFFSPYPTTKQTSHFTVYSSSVESYTKKVKPHRKSGDKISLGPYNHIEPFADVPFSVHYQNSYKFCTMTKVEREIEVSQWGRVSVSEKYWMRNTGPELTGEWSMLDHTRSRGSEHGIRRLETMLPRGAQHVYFRDQLGNISSSHMYSNQKGVKVELDVRFTLYGGWESDFELGYQMPSQRMIRTQNSDPTLHILKVPFSIPFDTVVDDLTVRVILPEGAADMDFELPYEVKSSWSEARYTYLDISGRPVLAFHKTNLVPVHREDFKVFYRFSRLMIFREPIMLISAFFALFLAAIGYSRINMQLPGSGSGKEVEEDSDEEEGESDVKSEGVENLVESLQQLFGRLREGFSQIAYGKTPWKKFESAFQSHRGELDQLSFLLTGSQKKTCVELKKQMKQWKQAVKRRDADAHERVLKEVDRLHKQLRQ